MDKAGVRFVYTSHQSYKRSKFIAGKLGLETDWNCAISLAENYRRHVNRDAKRAPNEDKHDTGGQWVTRALNSL